MDSGVWPGANRIHACRHGEDLQPRQAAEDVALCSTPCRTLHWMDEGTARPAFRPRGRGDRTRCAGLDGTAMDHRQADLDELRVGAKAIGARPTRAARPGPDARRDDGACVRYRTREARRCFSGCRTTWCCSAPAWRVPAAWLARVQARAPVEPPPVCCVPPQPEHPSSRCGGRRRSPRRRRRLHGGLPDDLPRPQRQRPSGNRRLKHRRMRRTRRWRYTGRSMRSSSAFFQGQSSIPKHTRRGGHAIGGRVISRVSVSHGRWRPRSRCSSANHRSAGPSRSGRRARCAWHRPCAPRAVS